MTSMTNTRIRTYSELKRLSTFDERYEYLRLGGAVGGSTFGFDRHVNQSFYSSLEWRTIRRDVILRDSGCDLGILGYEINGVPLVHHINPIAVDDIRDREDWILQPEYLITTTQQTHNAIHYGDESLLPKEAILINKEPSFIEENRTLVINVTIIIGILFFLCL